MPPLLRLFCTACLLIVGALGHAEEPFAFENTPGRLPKAVLPLRYEVHLEPDIEKATFSGHQTVTLDVRQPVREIVLHSYGLAISDARLQVAERTIPLTPKLNSDEQTLTLALDEELPTGRYQLALAFTGKLTEQPRGLYIARYQSKGVPGKALATQMEAIDCRRMFPCWDEPVFRAEFALTVVVPEKLRAVSNMPVANEKKRDDGRREVAFAPTPKMSSYLVALAVGDFEELSDKFEGIELRILTTPGKREQGRYALESTKKILGYFHDYFGAPYPLPKLDQLAIPSTGAGAMENWGLIIYNDNTLLYDPATSAQSTKERVFSIIAHEIAHQWFGNLVTMAWWDNLWLNEGFASWMGTKATEQFNPDWKVWLRAAGGKEWAMHLDARATTHPIQRPVLDDAKATDGFDEITYQKGQAVLRMIESWLGEESFRDGIRAYMKTHAYSNTTTADLWVALGKTSGKPVREFAAGWTEQPGFPVITLTTLSAEGQTVLQFEQERFTIRQKDAAPLRWQIPVIYGPAGAPHRSLVLLLKDKMQPAAPLEPEASIKANLGDVGYYRVAYDPLLAVRMLRAAPYLAESDRLNVLNDAWAMVQAGRTPAADCLDLVDALSDDRSPTVLGRIIDILWSIDSLYRGSANRDGFRAWAREFLKPHFERLTWEARPNESALDAELRGSLISILGAFGSDEIASSARARFASYLTDPTTLPGDLRGPVFAVVGRTADTTTWTQLHEAARAQDSFEQKRALYTALASARDPQLAAQTLALSLTDELIAPDAARLVSRVAHEGEQPELAWAFARKNLDALLGKVPSLYANNYVPGIFEGFDEAARADEIEAFAQKNLPPVAGEAVAKAADNIRFQAEFKARALPQIDAWWQARVRR